MHPYLQAVGEVKEDWQIFLLGVCAGWIMALCLVVFLESFLKLLR